jgi:C-terminal processing protease CtpA/Prc
MQVLVGSSAEKAGLKQGDEIVSIDGKPALSFPPDDQMKLFDEGPEGREVAIIVARYWK